MYFFLKKIKYFGLLDLKSILDMEIIFYNSRDINIKKKYFWIVEFKIYFFKTKQSFHLIYGILGEVMKVQKETTFKKIGSRHT